MLSTSQTPNRHTNLISILNEHTDHPAKIGYCVGTGVVGIYAFLFGLLPKFDRCLQYISTNSQFFQRGKNIVIDKIDLDTFAFEEQNFQGCHMLLRSIAMTQNPKPHTNNAIRDIDIPSSIELLQSSQLKNLGGIVRLERWINVYDVNELTIFFAIIKRHAHQKQQRMMFSLWAESHVIHLFYNPEAGEWILWDANHPLSYLPDDKLGHYLYWSFCQLSTKNKLPIVIDALSTTVEKDNTKQIIDAVNHHPLFHHIALLTDDKINTISPNRSCILSFAVLFDELDFLKKIASSINFLQEIYKRDLFQWALSASSNRMLSYFIGPEVKADVNFSLPNTNSGLTTVLVGKYLDSLKYLLQQGINIPPESFLLAIQLENPAILNELLNHMATLPVPLEQIVNTIFSTQKFISLEIMLKRGLLNGPINANGDNIAHYAARCGNMIAINLIAQNNLNLLYHRNNSLQLPIFIAAEQGHANIVGVLAHSKELLFSQSGHDWTLAHTAAWYGHSAVLRQLQLSGMNLPQVGEINGLTPANFAAITGKLPALIELARHGVDIFAANSQGKTPLDYANEHGHTHVANYLYLHHPRHVTSAPNFVVMFPLPTNMQLATTPNRLGFARQ